MPAVAEVPAVLGGNINPVLLDAIVASVHKAMDMCSVKIRCTGVSCVPAYSSGIVTGMIGVHGKVTGFSTVNLAERFAIRAVEGLLGETFGELSHQVVDGVGEIANIVVGGIKSALSGSNWQFNNITVPSVIVGKNFTIAYARGLEFITVSFEHEDQEAIRLEDRLMHVSLSMLVL